MIKIKYTPSPDSESQEFLGLLMKNLDPLDKDFQEAQKQYPDIGGAVEEIITNPITWKIVSNTISILIPVLVQIWLYSRKKESIVINDNSVTYNINFNDYKSANDFENDMKEKFGKSDSM